MTLTGTTANLNAALATLVYRGNLNYGGPDTLTVNAKFGSVTATAASVAINVVSAAQQAANLQAQVSALQTAGVLNGALATLLKTTIALQGNVVDILRVTAFIIEVDILQLAHILTSAQANALLAPADTLLLSVTRR